MMQNIQLCFKNIKLFNKNKRILLNIMLDKFIYNNNNEKLQCINYLCNQLL